MNYQKLTLIGNLTRDAERKTSKDGKTNYTTFRVAVSDTKERPIFFPITVFGKQGETIAEYLTKGREVLVEGSIASKDSGAFNVVADRVVLGNNRRQETTNQPHSES